MWVMLGKVLEMFVYSAVYMIIAIVSLKIMGASFFADFEKKIADENSLSVSLVCAATLIGLALILSSVIG
jgi:Ca2+/Na+ antiporter